MRPPFPGHARHEQMLPGTLTAGALWDVLCQAIAKHGPDIPVYVIANGGIRYHAPDAWTEDAPPWSAVAGPCLYVGDDPR